MYKTISITMSFGFASQAPSKDAPPKNEEDMPKSALTDDTIA